MYTNKQIWSVSYPILLSLLAQNVINVTDTAFLGHVSEVALGASAMGGLFYICVFTIAFGFSTGSQIVIARRNGEGRSDLRKATGSRKQALIRGYPNGETRMVNSHATYTE